MFQTIFDIIVAGVIMGGIYSLIAAGFNLQYGAAHILNVSHGEFIMLGAVGAYSLYALFGINPIISLAICGPIIFLIAIVVHQVVFIRLHRLSINREAFEGSSLLCCFGLLFIIQNIVSLAWGGSERGYSFLIIPIEIFGAIFAANRLMALFFAIVVGAGFYFFISHTRIGRSIRALTEDPVAAQLMGVSTKWTQGLCFGLGALLAGLAGVLMSTMYSVSPYMGLEYTVIAMIVVVLGGLGNIIGSMAGGIVLGLVGSFTAYFHAGFSLISYYLIFVILILARPEGLFSKKRQKNS